MSNNRKIGFADAVVLGLSSSGPAQTIAVSLAGLVAAVSLGGPLVILIAFLPMLGIALGYLRLNRWDPRAGATYNWVARVFHPYLGFMAGWMILLYYTLGTTSLTLPAGTYTLALLAPTLVDNQWAVSGVGIVWNILLTWLAVQGLRPAARFEWLSVAAQYALLGLLSVVGVIALWRGEAYRHFDWNWFSLSAMGGKRGIVTGLLVACFMYSGWDAAIYVNEESEHGSELPGRAAVASVIILAGFYALAALGLSAVLAPNELAQHAGNALDVIAPRLVGASYGTAISIVVLLGTLATLQAAVISAARVSSAMARDRVMPTWLARRDNVSGSPRNAMIAMGAINILFLMASLTAGSVGEALSNVVSSLGLLSVVFYGLTAAAAIWQGRDALMQSRRDALIGGLMPVLGVLFMTFVAVAAVATGALSRTVCIYGLGSIALGLVVALAIHLKGGNEFFGAIAKDRALSPENRL
jgi:amino acid transporter